MARFTVKGVTGVHSERYVLNGSWTHMRAEIEAPCFYKAIEAALRWEQKIVFQVGHELNSDRRRVYNNDAHHFLVERID